MILLAISNINSSHATNGHLIKIAKEFSSSVHHANLSLRMQIKSALQLEIRIRNEKLASATRNPPHQ
jgi:hypothetical protein